MSALVPPDLAMWVNGITLPTRARNVLASMTEDECRLDPRTLAARKLNCGRKTAFQIAGYLRLLRELATAPNLSTDSTPRDRS